VFEPSNENRTTPLPFLTVHFAYHGLLVPFEKEPDGSSTSAVPTGTENPFAGDLITAFGAAGAEVETVTVAVPVTDVPTAVAVIVTDVFEFGAVKRPVAASIEPPEAAQLTATAVVVPSERFPIAENC